MIPDRRSFLKSAAAAAGAGLVPGTVARAFAAPGEIALRPAPVELALGDATTRTRFWGFNERVPGPAIRVRKGETLRIVVDNALSVDTAVHWHGLRVPNDMDGVPYVTQPPIKPGQKFSYAFTAFDSGTYWYHPHQNSHEQVARGLYGPLIVEEEKPIIVDRDETWVISDAKLGADGQPVEDFGRVMDLANEGRLGTVVLVNGQPANAARSFPVRSGERLRLRLINAASARIFNLAFEGHAVQVIAHDGQAVEPYSTEVLVIGPGMRIDVVIDCMQKPGASLAVVDRHRRSLGALGNLVYGPEKPLRNKPLKAPIKLAPNRITEPDVAKATDHYIVFQGGMRGAPVIGTVDGKPAKIHEIMEKYGLAWTMNFTAQHEHALMHEPLVYLRKGEHVVLHLVNETDFWHPMHLHGHFFRVLAINGKRTARADWRDTVMMGPRENVDVAFVADNIGEWMFHCHVLDHAAGGMMGTFAVE
jgi:FtsP/CotA-like multicopper oxidase with cupredoxin domain